MLRSKILGDVLQSDVPSDVVRYNFNMATFCLGIKLELIEELFGMFSHSLLAYGVCKRK